VDEKNSTTIFCIVEGRSREKIGECVTWHHRENALCTRRIEPEDTSYGEPPHTV